MPITVPITLPKSKNALVNLSPIVFPKFSNVLTICGDCNNSTKPLKNGLNDSKIGVKNDERLSFFKSPNEEINAENVFACVAAILLKLVSKDLAITFSASSASIAPFLIASFISSTFLPYAFAKIGNTAICLSVNCFIS